jgi:hypothetical protein
MGMTPISFFEAFVEGNSIDCHNEPGDVRKAFNAAVSTSHVADQYFRYCKRHKPDAVLAFHSLGEFVEHLCRETGGAFRDIRSIANAYKHLYTNPEGGDNAYSSVDSTGSITAVQFSDDEEIVTVEEDYETQGSMKVVFKRKDGSKSEFLPVLDRVIDHFHTTIYGNL